ARASSGSRAASLLADYIVRTKDAAGQQRVVDWATAHGIQIADRFGAALYGATLTLADSLVASVSALPGVESVERDRPLALAGVETSPTWGLDRIDQRPVTLDQAYHYTASGAGVSAYVIDTGLMLTHTDFTGRVGQGAYYDFNDGTQASDCNGHGTHTSGTLGGTVYGVAKGVTIVPVKVLDCSGSGSNNTVIAGINWIVANYQPGVPAVASLSLGGTASADVDAAIQSMIDVGITVVVAAGNEHSDACGVSPARAPAAITVGAIDSSDNEASFSNFGSCVDIFAPGVNITSDWKTSDSAAFTASGTSMATPHVAGAAALVLEVHPTYTPAQVWNAINTVATRGRITFQPFDIGSPDKMLYTGTISLPSAPTISSVTPGNANATVVWAAPATDGDMPITGYRVQRSIDAVSWTTVGIAAPEAFSLKAGSLTNGVPYKFRVAAINYVGTGPDSAASIAAVPRTLPSAVGAIVAQPLNGSALLSWPLPGSNGGVAIRAYRVVKSTNGITWTTFAVTTPLTRTLAAAGLTNGVTYRFRVAAVNLAGVGAYSLPVAVTPRPVASAPGKLAAKPSSTRVALTWAAPVVRGGAVVTGYRVLKSANGVTWVLAASNAPLSRSFSVAGLANGISYRFRVAAVNAFGVGAWSAVTSATPHV
ncbi:MAG: S8 family serine peptidase, partial [Actinomycetota bacterium]